MTRPISYILVDAVRDSVLWIREKWEYFRPPVCCKHCQPVETLGGTKVCLTCGLTQ